MGIMVMSAPLSSDGYRVRTFRQVAIGYQRTFSPTLTTAHSWPSGMYEAPELCEDWLSICGTLSSPLDRWAMLGQLDPHTSPSPRCKVTFSRSPSSYHRLRGSQTAPLSYFDSLPFSVFRLLRLCSFPFWSPPTSPGW